MKTKREWHSAAARGLCSAVRQVGGRSEWETFLDSQLELLRECSASFGMAFGLSRVRRRQQFIGAGPRAL